ncbi:MAG: GGDEF domain-containing protein [Pseudomonadota bacterium]|nr:GGDEF domain-containing protein [Pseudomonadota bacterium]
MDSYHESRRQLARPYRKAVLKALLGLTLVAGLIFFTLNIQRQNYPLALAELGMALYSAYIFFAIRRTRHLERWILAYIFPFCITMMFALTTPRATSTVFAWVLLIPILSHLLLGRRLGLWISGLFMTTAAIIFYLKYRDVPEMMSALPIANMGIMALTILAFSHIYEITREQSENRLLKLAQTDPLTGLANRARLNEAFAQQVKVSQREGLPVALIVLDIDHFKSVNDRFGHDAGDLALEHVARIFRSRIRATDLASRMGGEEFVILLHNATAADAVKAANKIRHALEQAPLDYEGQTIAMTLSGGVAQLGPDGHDLRSLISHADRCLYKAKAGGRNRIEQTRPAEAIA